MAVNEYIAEANEEAGHHGTNWYHPTTGALTPLGMAVVGRGLEILQAAVWTSVEHKGFHDVTPPRGFPEEIALMHSELSEALEANRDGDPVIWYRDGNSGDKTQPFSVGTIEEPAYNKPEGQDVELGDVIIRIADSIGCHDGNLAAAVLDKLTYNQTRAYKHGKKF